MAEPMGRAASLGRTGSLQALGAQPRSFIVTTGDVVVRSSPSAFDQTEAACQVPSACHLVLLQHLSSARPRVFRVGSPPAFCQVCAATASVGERLAWDLDLPLTRCRRYSRLSAGWYVSCCRAPCPAHPCSSCPRPLPGRAVGPQSRLWGPLLLLQRGPLPGGRMGREPSAGQHPCPQLPWPGQHLGRMMTPCALVMRSTSILPLGSMRSVKDSNEHSALCPMCMA